MDSLKLARKIKQIDAKNQAKHLEIFASMDQIRAENKALKSLVIVMEKKLNVLTILFDNIDNFAEDLEEEAAEALEVATAAEATAAEALEVAEAAEETAAEALEEVEETAEETAEALEEVEAGESEPLAA